MTDRLPFFFVDVFADEPLTGNPLAVVADADDLDAATMGRIAREFNQAETTFVHRPTRAGAAWRLRSFTPGAVEVFGAGHNALGAWWWLADSGRLPLTSGRTRFGQEIGPEVLPVDIDAEAGRPVRIAMTQGRPVFGAVHENPAALAAALRLDVDDLTVPHPGGGAGMLPAQVVSTASPHLLVPVRSRAAVDRAAPDSDRLAAELASVHGEGCYLFSLDPIAPDAAAYTRFFNPTVGIVEDAATGTAAGPLARQLVAFGLVADGSRVVLEQGYALDRPSRIEVAVSGDEIVIAGRGVVTAEGMLTLPPR